MRKHSAINIALLSALSILAISSASWGELVKSSTTKGRSASLTPIMSRVQRLDKATQMVQYAWGTGQNDLPPSLADKDPFQFESHLPFSQRARDSQLNFEALPDFVTFLSETLGGDRDRRNAFYVPPLNVTSGPPAVTFDYRNISRFSNLEGSYFILYNLEWNYVNQSIIEVLSSRRRIINDAQLDNSLGTASDIGIDEVLRQLPEAAPNGGQYWLEDPNAAWW
jgi:hypothetical protein